MACTVITYSQETVAGLGGVANGDWPYVPISEFARGVADRGWDCRSSLALLQMFLTLIVGPVGWEWSQGDG